MALHRSEAMAAKSACTANELRQRTRALCQLVVETGAAKPVHSGYVEVLLAGLAHAPAGQLGDALSRPLCDLAASLLSDLPFRLVREAMALLHAAALGAAAATQSRRWLELDEDDGHSGGRARCGGVGSGGVRSGGARCGGRRRRAVDSRRARWTQG